MRISDWSSDVCSSDLLERKAIAEGLAGLPRSYGDIKVPQLGPPLAGDLGPPIVRAEREAGVRPDYSIRPSPEDDAARAERLRLARKAQQAREAGVFFQVSAKQIGRAHV